MSNEQAKQAAIIKAWGEYWERLSPRAKTCVLEKNGRLDVNRLSYDLDKELSKDVDFCSQTEVYTDMIIWFRPLNLRGIENNRGWTRIEPDGSNLPEEVAYYEVCINGIPWGHPQPLQFLVRTFHSPAKDQLTHFKKWEPSKPPVY